MFINAHTHHINLNGFSVLNIFPLEEVPQKSVSYIISCGIHPWHINSINLAMAFDFLEELIKDRVIHAVGECGLDKNISDMQMQEDIFLKHIYFSELYQLPLIIHSVKSNHLILNIRKSTGAKQPWIIHGFNGSFQEAQQFIKQNIFLSLGPNLFRNSNKALQLLNYVDLDFVLLETDESDVNIEDVYLSARQILGITQLELETQIMLNFKTIFKERWIG